MPAPPPSGPLGTQLFAGTVVLLEYFGRDLGSQLLSFVWFIVATAAAGRSRRSDWRHLRHLRTDLCPLCRHDGRSFYPIFLMRRPADFAADAAVGPEAELIAKANAI